MAVRRRGVGAPSAAAYTRAPPSRTSLPTRVRPALYSAIERPYLDHVRVKVRLGARVRGLGLGFGLGRYPYPYPYPYLYPYS